jgi:hypothetical protein
VRELIEQKRPKVRQELACGEDWSLVAAAELNARQGLPVDLPALDEALTA